MGNRAMIKFVETMNASGIGDSPEPLESTAVYLHNNADDVKAWLRAAAPTMRKGCVAYAAARFIGYCANQIPGGYSLGVYVGSAAHDPENGLYVVECNTGKVTLFRQNFIGDYARSGRPFTIKLGDF